MAAGGGWKRSPAGSDRPTAKRPDSTDPTLSTARPTQHRSAGPPPAARRVRLGRAVAAAGAGAGAVSVGTCSRARRVRLEPSCRHVPCCARLSPSCVSRRPHMPVPRGGRRVSMLHCGDPATEVRNV